jgi:hypothetical protein
MKKKPRSKKPPEPTDNRTAGELFSFEVVECERGGFGIKMDGRDMLLPYGKPFWSPGRAYAEHTLRILAEGGPEHFNKNRTLVCHTCTLFIHFSSGVVTPKGKAISAFRRTASYCATFDPIHKPCLGPEAAEQLARLGPFKSFCADRGITPPKWSQEGIARPDATTDIRKIVEANSNQSTAPSALRYFEVLEREMHQLSQAQVAVMHTYFNYCDSYEGRPFVLPLLLVKGVCSPKDFAEGFLAMLCVIPGVFGDVSTAEYKRELAKIERDAERALFFLDNH